MASLSTDILIREAALYFIPVETRIPLKFGPETLTSVTCARVRVTVEDRRGRRAEGWGETPLNVQWVWPGALAYSERHQALKQFSEGLAGRWVGDTTCGHPVEIGSYFAERVLGEALASWNSSSPLTEPMPRLAALVCLSAYDIATHDAFGNLLGLPVYATYSRHHMNADLAAYLEPAVDSDVRFEDTFPSDYLLADPPAQIPAWHLVGGLDPVSPEELTGDEPDDGYPMLLSDWIKRDGLTCLKVKLRGDDANWDYARLVRVGDVASPRGVRWLSADFNCTVTNPEYVNEILDRLKTEHPRLFDMLLYVEQPFPYDLEANRIDVHSVSKRKPLFMDESAHDWRLVRLGRELGWNGVALKTCKTQTGALLTQAWAKAHGMSLMVQDLSNPMLAQLSHVQLGAHAYTIMGVETNGMQFYPEASAPEAAVHPGLYARRNGCVDLSTLGATGFGYRLGEIHRNLPEAAIISG